MSIVVIIFRPIFTFIFVASFSLFFMQLFFVAGILSTKIQRNITDDIDEGKRLKGYATAAFGGLIGGSISLAAMAFL
ncbi:MAG: hypothetical protein Q8R55_07500 [Candidatus Taylorbacteria bacterium]|nr:hypothetical protein [Candidatus Taylorbacteria bacterium]